MICIPSSQLSLGQIVITAIARKAIRAAGQRAAHFLRRHSSGDWGEIYTSDKFLADSIIVRGERMLSAYRTSLGVRLFVVTEADASVTTIMSPEEL